MTYIMTAKHKESLARLFYDLVKVPLALCMLASLTTDVPHLLKLEVFGGTLVLLFAYIAYQIEAMEDQ